MRRKRYTVRAFGRLEVESAEGPVALGGPRPRTVFAVLLVARRAVSTDRLVDETWGSDPPSGARRTLQGYVSALRRSLGGDDGPLRSEASGYCLDYELLDVDLATFEALAMEGRDELASQRPEDSADLLDRALGIWADEPFADLPVDDVPTLRIERTRLGELRMNAVEARVEAGLLLGRARDLVPELERLVAVHPEREGLWRHLMVALHESGRTAEAMRAAERCRRFLAGELGLDPGEELRRLEHRIAAGERVVDGAALRTDLGPVACPYKGLAVYLPEDRALYFGREQLLDRLIARMAERPLVALVGPSGTGKSSLVRAGLVPALAAGALPGAPWDVSFATPGANPLREVSIPPPAPGRRSLLVIDQFEELYTRCPDQIERGRLLERLAEAVSGDDGTRRVVVAIRADFYGWLAENEDLAALVSDGTLLVGPMSTAELERAITGPALQVGLSVEPALVDAIVADAGSETGALPLVSHALVETWARRVGSTLTLAGYLQAGGVVGALAQTADRTIQGRLSPRQQAAARDLLLRLVEPAEEGPDTRRTVLLEELLGASTDAGDAEMVIAVLTEARLLTVDEGGVRLTHEALTREWPTLRSWLDQERHGLLVRRQLAEDARRWNKGGRDAADLLGGLRLAAVAEWRQDTALPLTDLEADFLDESLALAEQQRREADERAALQARSNRRLRLLVAVVLVAFLGAASMGVVAFRQWQRADASAEAAMARQLAAQVDAVRDTDLDLALLLAAEAVGFADRAETRRVLLGTLHEEPRLRRLVPVGPASWSAVEVSGDGSTLVALDQDGGSLTIISLDDGRPVGPAEVLPDPEHSLLPPVLAISEEGRLAAVQQSDGTVHVFDGATGRRTGVVISHGIASGALAFGPDDDWLAIQSVMGPPGFLTSDDEPTASLVVVNPLTGDRLGPELVVADFAPVALSVAPDGGTIAAVDRFFGAVAVWRWPDATTMSRFFGPEGAGTIAVDGGRVAVAGDDTIRVHDAASGRPVTGPLDQPTAAASLAFAPGDRLVTGAIDGWRVWDLEAPRQQGPAVTGGGRVDALAVVGEEDVVTAGLGGETAVWSLEGPPVIGTRLPVPFAGFFAPDRSRLVSADPAHPGRATMYDVFPFRPRWEVSLGSVEDHADRFAWTADGERIAAITRAGDLVVLSATDGAIAAGPVALPAPTAAESDDAANGGEQVRAVAFSPAGDRLAVATSGGRVLVVEPDTGRLYRGATDAGRPVNAIVFESSDRLLAGGDDGVVYRLEIDDGRLEALLSTGRAGAIHVLSPAPGGRLVVGGADGFLSMWRMSDGSRTLHLDAGSDAVRGVALSPDDRWLAATLETGETRMFDTESGAPAGVLGVASSIVAWPHPAAFSPDGSALATWDNNSYVVWSFDPAAWQEVACTMAGRSLTEAEVALFFEDRARAPACAR